MFDLGATELFLIAVVAVLVIGPKDMPLALRAAGRWMGKMRRISSHFRSGIDTMIREAEVEEMEKKWRDQNDQIIRDHPEGVPSESEMSGAPLSTSPSTPTPTPTPTPSTPTPSTSPDAPQSPPAAAPDPAPAKASAETRKPAASASGKGKGGDPQLPLDSPPSGD